MKVETFLILLLGAVVFLTVSYIVDRLFWKKNGNKTANKKKNEEIVVPAWLIVALIIYDLITLGLLLHEVLNIASQFGEYNSLPEALTIFKNATSYSGKTRLPSYITIMIKPLFAGAFLATYIFLHNILCGSGKIYAKVARNIIWLIFPIFYVVQRLMESSRGPILNFALGALCMALIIWYAVNEWKKTVRPKVMAVAGIIGVAGMMIFYLTAPMVGRINSKNMFDYITFYIGGSVECLNQWAQKPEDIEVVRGEYTFAGTIRNLNSLGVADIQLQNKHKNEFVYYKGEMVGNIYTSYRAWIHDFGILGMYVLQAIMAAFFTIIYMKIRLWDGEMFNFRLLFYGFSAYTIFMHPIDGYFYLEFPTIAMLTTIACLAVMFYGVKLLRKGSVLKKGEYYIQERSPLSEYSASSKAREDAEKIFEKNGIRPLVIPSIYGVEKRKILKWKQLFTYLKNAIIWDEILTSIPSGSRIYIQYPLTNTCYGLRNVLRRKQKRGVQFVALVHDLDSVRYCAEEQGKMVYKRVKREDENLLAVFDCVIVHNEAMKEYLSRKMDGEKIISLGVFDYLAEDGGVDREKTREVAIAGNLSKEKAEYIYDLAKVDGVIFKLYGTGYSASEQKNISYEGSYTPKALLKKIDGAFGLVWDGKTIDSCSGKFGEYLKINNPHKVSMYIAAGMPIIIWQEAALANWVKKEKLGVTVASIRDIPATIDALDKKKYSEMMRSIEKHAKIIKKGGCLTRAIAEAREKLT